MTAEVAEHGVIRLNKFASMGSALCFPFEAIVFATVVFMGIEKELGRQLTRRDIKSFKGQVRVYGDDIIVPTHFAVSVVSELEAFGFKVNSNKSFWAGRFRESCGKEYFDGHDVTITRVRRMLPTSRKDAPEIVSTVALRNLLFKAGFDTTVDWLDSIIGKLIPFPIVEETSPLLGRLSWSPLEVTSWDFKLQRPLVRGAVLDTTIPDSHLEGYGALLKFFLTRQTENNVLDYLNDDLPVIAKDHLERSGRPVSVRIKIRKGSPY